MHVNLLSDRRTYRSACLSYLRQLGDDVAPSNLEYLFVLKLTNSLACADLLDEILHVILESAAQHLSGSEANVLFHLARSCKTLKRIIDTDENSAI